MPGGVFTGVAAPGAGGVEPGTLSSGDRIGFASTGVPPVETCGGGMAMDGDAPPGAGVPGAEFNGAPTAMSQR